ncbi:MAG: AAA family ATPase [Acidiferrobacteraceae bacterium]|jgi:protein-tyrosine kinase
MEEHRDIPKDAEREGSRKVKRRNGSRKTAKAKGELVEVAAGKLVPANGKSLGISPRYEIARMREPWQYEKQALAEMRIISPEMPDRGVVDAYRRMRTKIVKKNGGENPTIMVTGISHASGVTFTALNLAAAFAFDESKTALVIDCNFRSQGMELGEEGDRGEEVDRYGLADYLDDEMDDVGMEEIIHPTGIRRMRLIPSGGEREGLVEYFTSTKMSELVESAKQRYRDRYIIIDTPPILESADTGILTDLCDYVILVVPYGRFTQQRIVDAARAIGQDKFLGAVFNDVPHVPDVAIEKLKTLWDIPRASKVAIDRLRSLWQKSE